METTPYLIFSLKYCRYGIEAHSVREVFFLPQLSPVMEAPRDIVGVLNLRGTIVPVMDLNLRFGSRWREYTPDDSVIVLEWDKLYLGIIVDRVYEVQMLSSESISPALDYGRESDVDERYPEAANRRFVAGVASSGSDIITLLDCQRLMRDSQDVKPRVFQSSPTDAARGDRISEERGFFSCGGTPQEREIFRQRAEVLRQTVEDEDARDTIPLAVVGLNEEYFGIDLRMVREFTEIHQVTPVPCCPPHIIGNMNLRGEIVTLVAIRGLLNLPRSLSRSTSKAIVVQVDEVVAGITVDEVFDVTYVHPSELAPLPATASSADEGFLRGTAPYKDKIVTVLDMVNILTSERAIVDEEVR